MRIICSMVVAFLISATLFGQAPASFKYQTVVRNSSGQLITNTQVTIQIAILKGSISGASVYTESFSPTTNNFGLVNLNIGTGTVVSGNFANIDWGADTYFIKVLLNSVEMGTSQLLSVPYALYSKKAETISGNAITGNENAFTGWDKNTTDDFNGNYNSLTGIPSFSTVATSGSYSDLTNKPTLFDGTWTNLTGKPTTLTGYGIMDAMSTTHPANGITALNITDWNNAFSWGNHATAGYQLIIREVSDEFTATASQTSFTLSQIPSANSKVKMFINGVRISNTAYSNTGNALTYNPVNNGSYTLSAGDRIQFDYFY